MQALVYEKFGNPKEVLALRELPVPEPKAGEVLLKLIKSPIHYHDIAIIRGAYGYRPPLPAIPGSEGVARIEKLGEGVSGFQHGQRVAVSFASNVWAEYFTAPAAMVVPLPDAVSDDAACQLFAMPLSAILLMQEMHLQSGDWIVQSAANGTVGRIIIQLARAQGINVINLVRRADGIDELKAAGAQHVFSSDDEGWSRKAREVTGRSPVIRAIDSVGGATSLQLLSVLGKDGQLISFGSMSGQPMQIDSGKLIFANIQVRGFWGGALFDASSAEAKRALIANAVTLVANKQLDLPLEGEYPMNEIQAALTHIARPGKVGKIALGALV